MKRLIAVILLISLLIPGSIVLASDISNSQYMATVRVTNNSTAASLVIVPITGANTNNLINQGFMNATANDSALRSSAGADMPFEPGYNALWYMFVSSISADSIVDYTWYNNATGGENYYIPGTAGMTVADNANIELGNHSSVNISGYFDTTGTITASILSLSTELLPNATGDACAIASQVGAACPNHYQNVDEANAAPNNADYVYNDTIEQRDYYNLQNGTIPTGATIDSITVYMRADIGDGGHTRPYLRLAGTNTIGTIRNVNGAFTTYSEVLSRPGGGPWSVSDITSLQVGCGVWTTNFPANVSQLSVVVAYHILTTATVADGEYDIEVAADTNNLEIFIDSISVNSTVMTGATVNNNGNAWAFAKSGYSVYKANAFSVTGTMLYVESVNISTSGSQKAHWSWQYGSTFTDTINSIVATPSFRTTSSDPDVSAEFIDFRAVSTALAPGYSVDLQPDFITANITANSTFTSGNYTSGTRPGDDVINAAAEAAGVPNIWLWGILGMITIALAGFLVSYLEKQYGSGQGTMFLRFGITILILGVMVTFGIFDFWMLVIYTIIAVAMMMASRQQDFNMSMSQLNLIGFLAMTWLGLTMINQIQAGQLLTTAETAQMNRLMFTQEYSLLDTFKMPILNFEFFSVGIPSLLAWDYSFFGGNAQIIQYMLYSLTAVISFIVLMITIGTISSYFVRST